MLTFVYPHTYNPRFCDNTLLLSGGEDFTARLWNLYTGSLLHTFRAHSGPVCSLHAVPADLAVSREGDVVQSVTGHVCLPCCAAAVPELRLLCGTGLLGGHLVHH